MKVFVVANQRNLSPRIAGLVGAERAYCVRLSMLSKLVVNFVYPPLFSSKEPPFMAKNTEWEDQVTWRFIATR